MKKIILKSIIVMMVAFVAASANAQNVVNSISTHDFQACGEYLVKNPKDTVVSIANISKDGMHGVVKRSVYLKENNTLAVWNDTVLYRQERKVVQDSATLEAMQKVSEEALAVEKLSKGSPRDIYYGNSDELKTFVNGQGLSYPDAGKIPMQVANKYGWGFQGHVGYALTSGASGIVGGLGLTYGREYWDVSLIGEIGRSKYSDNAIKAGKSYMTYRVEALAGVRPVQLDANDINRLSIFAGGGLEYGETDSKAYTDPSGKVMYLSSTGGYPYLTAGIKFEHRIFATGNLWGVSLQYLDTYAIVQSKKDQKFGSFVMRVFFNFGLHRDKVRTK